MGNVRNEWRIEYLLAKERFEVPTIPVYDPEEQEEAKQPPPVPVEVVSVRHKNEHMLTLNSENFATTVMKDDSQVEHWIIKFCIDSWQCRKLSDIYKELSMKWQKSLNFSPTANLPDRFVNTVRFAEVDCSTEKQLCIEQGVESLPSVHHIHRKDLGTGSSKISAMHTWSDEVHSLSQWIESKLSDKVAKSKSAKAAQSHESSSEETSMQVPGAEPKQPNAWQQATEEISVLMQDFDDFLDKQEVPRHAAYTCVLAITVAIFASLSRLGWWQESPPMASPPVEAGDLPMGSAQSPTAMQQPEQHELRRTSRTGTSYQSGSMEL
eukprot:gnl/TRDRNA2_/TRDRNA2_85941_c1_seq3.p1 gnl/TRDRNA2_/TRDRNA2_85941_c1~~gnl/TRDRNA2_/TRDRNA2_85941_c1_seq3.p1  ORF type:complete len:379 (+),score=74.27 gnl/TRDRNA2_/TRDRNA2_85941_c1_seq3:171-1139(+)